MCQPYIESAVALSDIKASLLALMQTTQNNVHNSLTSSKLFPYVNLYM